jgi:uncharacterized membrane protein
VSEYLNTTIAVYPDVSTAQADWSAIEAAAEAGRIVMADGALLENQKQEAVIVQRKSHHGWGKGAVAGAIVGVLFPPSIIVSAAVGAGGGALVSRMTRSLNRGQVKELGEALDSGEVAIIVVYPIDSTNLMAQLLKGATTVTTVPSSTVEEVKEAMTNDSANIEGDRDGQGAGRS